MFELIQANRRRSRWLLAGMLFVLLGVGFTCGFVLYPVTDSFAAGGYRYFIPVGGLMGMAVAFSVWGVQALLAWSSGDRLIMAAAGAREIQKHMHPQLFNIVEEMTLAAQLPAMPKVYIIEDMSLNAFAAGKDPKNASVAVTAGLLSTLNRDQLQGVIAHEIAHIANRDVQFMTFAGIMLGSIILITELFHRSIWYATRAQGSMRRYNSRGSKKDGGGAAILLVLLVVSLILAVVAPLLAQLLYFACSRRREYLADAGGAVFTRYPEGLASALEVIAGNPGDRETTSRAMAPMYIINPLQGKQAFNSLLSTHPPVDERIRILRGMGGGSSYKDYASAWGQVSGAAAVDMPLSALHDPSPVPLATPRKSPATPPPLHAAVAKQQARSEARQRHRETGDMLRHMHNYRFINCECGLKAKIPPDYRHDKVKCPRCGKVHSLSS
jgi:heat shock protein HtpX